MIHFLNMSSGDALSYDWDFDDGNSSSVFSPSHHYENPGTYEVTLTITTADDCTNTFKVTISLGDGAASPDMTFEPTFLVTTSTEDDIPNTALKLYPNPATDKATLEFESPRSESAIITVFNMNGAEIKRQQVETDIGLNQIQLNTEGLLGGVYWVKYQSSKLSRTKKLIIAR